MTRRLRHVVLSRAALVASVSLVLSGLQVAPALALSAGQNASISLSSTVSGSSFEPTLGIGLTADRADAIPGDRIGYTARVTNTGAVMSLSGSLSAASSADVVGTVTSWYDEVQYKDKASNSWVSLGGELVAQDGYTPVETPAASTGLTLTATPVAADGVTYPSGSDAILGTQIGAHDTASWTWSASVVVTAAQEKLLADKSVVGGVRNVVHLEMQPRDPSNGEPYVDRETVVDPFLSGSGAIGDVHATLSLPNGHEVGFDSSTDAGLASVAVGESVSLTGSYLVPVVTGPASDETDAVYLQRLASVDGTSLIAGFTASGIAPDGSGLTGVGSSVNGAEVPRANAVSTEHLPVLTIAKTGPADADAGTTARYDLPLADTGSAPASGLAVTDSVPDGSHGTVTGVPAGLAPGATASAAAAYPIPDSQPSGSLTDTATVSWTDANGNGYGPVSASYTTTVHSTYAGATLTVRPGTVGPDVVGTAQAFTATLLSRDGTPLADTAVSFAAAGANAAQGSDTTDANGVARFTYTGHAAGNDTVQATATGGGVTVASNTATVGWIVPIEPMSTTTVSGNFFAEPAGTTKFVATPGDTPAFGGRFPTVTFNPPASAVPHNITGVTDTTRPFSDVTLDPVGNGIGTLPAAGNGHQAGLGDMASFNAVFTASFTVAAPTTVTYKLTYDSAFVFGVGGGATATGAPGGSTAFSSLPVLAADNAGAAGERTATFTVTYPAAGTYPYELDYAGGGDPAAMTLVLSSVQPVAGDDPLTVYTGYDGGYSYRPKVWAGSPGVRFVGLNDGDEAAIRFDNSSTSPIAIDRVTVNAGSYTFNPWATKTLVVPAGGTLIISETGYGNFDVDDYIGECSKTVSHVNVTIGGVTKTYDDTPLAFNGCSAGEGHDWAKVGTGSSGVVRPIEPAATVQLTPLKTINTTVGKQVTVAVSVVDGAGQPAANVPVALKIWGGAFYGAGANTANTPPATVTDASGFATFSYVGTNDGTDTLQAIATVTGMQTISNTTDVVWTVPPYTPPPSPSPSPSTTDTGTPSPSPTGTGTPSPSPTTTSPTPSPSTTSPAPSPSTTSPAPSPTTTSPTPSPTSTSPSPSPSPTSTAPAGAPPAIVSPMPADGSRVTAPTPVSASIQPPAGATITDWTVTAANVDGGSPTTIGSGTGAPPATLATFDPTTVADGTYRITVSATASTGGVQTVSTTVVVDGKLKPGRFAATWHDLDATLGTGSVRLLRSYDSTVTRSGDFGYGWSLAVDGYRVTANRQLGAGGWVQYDASCTLGLCTTGYRTTVPHFVSVTFPDGHTEAFDFTPTGETLDYWLAHAAFTARPGTTSTLQALGDTDLIDQGDGNLYDENTLDPYAPTQYQLTTRTGEVLVLDVNAGLVSATEPSGVKYTFTSSGITSSAGGGGAKYTRDAQGRITQIDALGTTQYGYDAAGNLASVTDPAGAVTTYTYDASHNLVGVTGPGGAPLRTMHYDAAGRLTSVTDANGNTTQVSTDLGANTLTVTDPTGTLTTVSTLDDLGDVVRKVETGDGKSRAWSYTYDQFGHQLTETDPLGHTTTSTYDAAGDRLSATDAAGHVTRWTYGTQAQLLTKTDSAGGVTTYTYDAHLNLTSMTDPAGDVVKYAYDGSGRPISKTDARGGVTGFSYDSSGRLASSTDPMGRVSSYTYDARGDIASKTDPTGGTTSYTYDGDGRRLSATDPLGHTTSHTYDTFGNLTSTTDPAGGVTRNAYAGDGQLAKSTDPDGRVTAYTYDADGRILSTTAPGGRATANTYDAFGDLASVVDPAGRETDYGYDAAGRKTAETRPNGKTWHYGYDAADHQTSTVDPLGHETDYGYDPLGQLTAVTDPLGQATRYTYTAAGDLKSVTDAAGNATTYGHDALGDVTTVVDATGQTTAYGYDPAGELASTTDPTGRTTSYTYTPLGKLATSTDPAGHVTSYGYDAAGNRASVTKPSGITTRYGYDAANRPTSETDGLGDTATSEYDAAGLLTATVDRRGNRTTYGYDSAGRLATLTDPLGGVVTLGYDADGEETSVTDPDSVTTTYGYDPLGDRTSQTDALGNTKTWSYDAAGRLASATNARGQATTYAYDATDRLTGTSSPDGDVSYGYDAAGNRTSLTDPTGTTTFGYDADGRITQVAAPAGTVSYGYDAAGRRTSVDVDGRTVTYSYSTAGLLASLTDASGTTTFGYDADGNPTSVLRPNGVESSYGYDGADRLVSVHHDTTAGASVAHFDYTLDANGDRIAVAGPDGTDSYTIDAAGRLTAESGPDGTASYTYTPAGNRSSRTSGGTTTAYTYDQAGRLSTAGGVAYGFDPDGNLTTAGGDTFTYDAAGHLTAANVAGTQARYRYDGAGLRVATTSGGTTTPYVLDRAATLPTVLAAGGHGYTRSTDGTLVGDGTGGSELYPLADALGSTRALTDGTGAVVGTTAYDAYGNAASSTGQQSAFGYTGALTDGGGLVDLNAREYDPATGRFLQADSYETGGPGTTGYNRYTYATDNPATITDPTGHDGDLESEEAAMEVNDTVGSAWSSALLSVQSLYYRIGYLLVTNAVAAEGATCTTMEILNATSGEGFSADNLAMCLFLAGLQHAGAEESGTAAEESTLADGTVEFSEVDALGRPTGIRARLSKYMLGTGSRASVNPPGFEGGEAGQARGHLLARSLGGPGNDPRNIVTLFQNPVNTPQMSNIEREVYQAVDAGQIVDYEVTPIYDGDNLVPSQVHIKATGSGGLNIDVTLTNAR